MQLIICQWQLKPLAPGTSPPYSWSKKLVDASQQSCRTQEKQCSCSSTYLLLFKGGMRSPSWLHSTPCDIPSWSLFLLSLIFMPEALCWWAQKLFNWKTNNSAFSIKGRQPVNRLHTGIHCHYKVCLWISNLKSVHPAGWLRSRNLKSAHLPSMYLYQDCAMSVTEGVVE